MLPVDLTTFLSVTIISPSIEATAETNEKNLEEPPFEAYGHVEIPTAANTNTEGKESISIESLAALGVGGLAAGPEIVAKREQLISPTPITSKTETLNRLSLPVMLFIHGLGSNKRVWTETAEALCIYGK
jgi:hypothetical protein